ncbi:uncharacterized protein BJX67DRAFT_141765 [Aspergillus lucknowensis]|uniref:Apple domain-containing protein n=1 Tax=Aspergillus lucknowensis TaxID=176173 RepID=A0ABR4LNV1_9EURO
MKIAPFWVSIALSTVVTESIATSASTTSTAATPTCTASLITDLCNYPDPEPGTAAAEDSRASCWEYCNDHPPCDFVIFAAGNPYLGTGACWLYPGETFDKSKGSSDCANPYLSVYDKPKCTGGDETKTPTDDPCAAAIATPSPIASVCGYPTPPDGCFNDCIASSGAPDCLSQCAKAESCSYVVFNPGLDSHSPYVSGSCWMYPNGTFDAESAGECSGGGDPDQFVYTNPCPKPSPTSTTSSSATESSSGTGTAGATTTGSTASAAMEGTSTDKDSAPGGVSPTYPLAIGVAMLIWQALY